MSASSEKAGAAAPRRVPQRSSADHAAALAEARRLAALCQRPIGSADVLLGILRAGGAAARLLRERGLTAGIEAALPEIRIEPGFDLPRVERTSFEIASQLGAGSTSSLHLLLALLRAGGSASDLLRRAGHDPARIRSLAMRALTGPARIGERGRPRTPDTAGGKTAAPATVAPEPQVAASAAPQLESEVQLEPLDPPALPVLHREREIGRLLDLLETASNRIVCVLGDPGTGRTVLLAALSAATGGRLLRPDRAPAAGQSWGAFVQTIDRLAPATAPVVLDECPGLYAEGSDAPAQLLTTAQVGRPWLLVATPADLRRIEANAPELAVRLEPVALAPLPPDALFEIVDSALEAIGLGAGVPFAEGTCRTLLRLGPRYPSERGEPGRSIALAELAAGRAARLGRTEVADREIAEVVADAAGVPAARLLRTEDERFASLAERLAARVVGHDTARERIADILRRSYAGFRGRRPLASLLLLGPTGVGKTETARAIADALFDGEAALVRVDLSEYSEAHSVARFVGSPPGYVGHEEGGQLTEAVRRRPASVVLLDEIEKAHRDVLLLLLQVLEDGRLTDGRGRTVDFSASVVVMTSNLASELYFKSATRHPAPSTVLALARSRLPPELWNRIDETLCFEPLEESELRRVVEILAADSSRRLELERGVSYVIEPPVVDRVLALEPDRSLGARPLRRAFERLVEGRVAAELLAGRVREGARLRLSCNAAGEISVALER